MAAKSNSKSDIDWKSLKTAKGPATRVPALVKALAGKKDADRLAAARALRELLYANGSVAPATPPTVSLLIDVIRKGEGTYLAAQLIGDSLAAGHLRWLADPKTSITGPIAEVRRAALEGKDALIAVLEDDDARVRAASAFALAFLPAAAQASRPALRKRLATETDDHALISQALAAAILAQGGDRAADDDRALAALKRRGGQGRGAALALAGVVLRAPKIEGLSDLAASLEAPYAPASMPWGHGLLSDAVVALATGTEKEREVAVEMLASLDEKTPVRLRWVVGKLAMALGRFKTTWKEWDVALPEELSDTQRAIALGLARHANVEGLGWAIPRSVRCRRRWLGLAPAGALEKIVDVRTSSGKKSWPAWKAWRELGLSDDAVEWPPPIIAALSADELLEAYAEVCGGAYGLNANRGDPPIQPVLDALPKVTKKAVAWARAYFDELNAMLAAESAPELGGSLGISGMMAVYLAYLARDQPIPAEFYPHLVLSTLDGTPTRAVLQRMGPKAEEALWTRMTPDQLESDPGFFLSTVIPLLDIVASKRIVERLLQALEALPEDYQEKPLAKLRALAPKVPAVAAALR